MKKTKLVAALLVAALFAFAGQVKAQNDLSQIYLNSQGQPGVSLNTGGSVYGQVYGAGQGSAQPNNTVLGYGSTSCSRFSYGCAAGTAVVQEGPLNVPPNPAGSGASGGLLQLSGIFAAPSSQVGTVSGGGVGQGIYVSTTIPVNTTYEVLLSSGGNLLLTATPTISTVTSQGLPLPDGSFLVITTTDTKTITLQSNGALAGSLIKLGATSRAITQYKGLVLRFNAALGLWLEESYFSDAN